MTAFSGTLRKRETACVTALLRFLAKSGVGILGIGILTACALLLHWDLATIAPLYFLGIVLAALNWGFWQATVISAALWFASATSSSLRSSALTSQTRE